MKPAFNRNIAAITAVAVILGGCATPEQRAKEEADFREIQAQYEAARDRAALVLCESKEQCDKVFRVATEEIRLFSSMKIQTATDTYVATYSPISIGDIGMTAERRLGQGDEEWIAMSILCDWRLVADSCMKKSTLIYKHYALKLQRLNLLSE